MTSLPDSPLSLWLDQYGAYELLSPELKQAIERKIAR